MKRYHFPLSLLFAFCLTGIGQAAMAQPFDGPPPPREGGMHQPPMRGGMDFQKTRAEFLKKLNLNEDQKKALKAHREKREELKIEMQRLKLQGMELMHLIKKSSSSESEVLKKVEEINTLQAKINTSRATNALELKRALTEERFAKIIEALEGARKMGHGHGMGEGPGDGHRPPRRGPMR